MILPDANLLIYATNDRSPFHARAKAWWNGALNGGERIGLPWAVSLTFLRLVTKPTVVAAALPVATATDLVREWYALAHVEPIQPGRLHGEILFRLLQEAGTAGDLVSDAHLAALAIEHRATLCSHDRDFERFSGFALFDPLV